MGGCLGRTTLGERAESFLLLRYIGSSKDQSGSLATSNLVCSGSCLHRSSTMESQESQVALKGKIAALDR
eukprot:6299087-Amphidinium_carterae.1